MNPKLSGQDLVDDIRIQLGGLSNAFTVDQLLNFINKGVQETWSVIRSLDLDYFGDSTQNSDATQDQFFANLSTTVREYPLPANCREPRFIEVLSPGFQDREFEYRKFDDPIYQAERRGATANGTGGSSSAAGPYHYTIFGNQLILAEYPEATLQVKIWYVKAVDAVSIDDFPDILHPFNGKITDYATERAMKATLNVELDEDWMATWKESIKTLALTVGPRVSTNPIFVADYWGA